VASLHFLKKASTFYLNEGLKTKIPSQSQGKQYALIKKYLSAVNSIDEQKVTDRWKNYYFHLLFDNTPPESCQGLEKIRQLEKFKTITLALLRRQSKGCESILLLPSPQEDNPKGAFFVSLIGKDKISFFHAATSCL